MKTFALFLALIGSPAPSLATVDDRVPEPKIVTFAEWADHYTFVEEVNDFDTVTVRLPFVRGMKTTAEITNRSQIIGEGDNDCSVLSAGVVRGAYQVVARLGETNWDDGMNSCTLTITGQLPGSRKVYKVEVEYGHHIGD